MNHSNIKSVLNMDTVNRKGTGILSGGKDNKSGLGSLLQGQQISGLVIAVGKNIIFDIRGQEVAASRAINPQAVPGDRMLFDVLRVTAQQIELGIAGNGAISSKALVTIKRLDSDREAFLSRKEQSGKLAGRENEYQNSKNNIEKLMLRMTKRDYQVLEQEGLDVQKLTVSGLNNALDRIKSTDSKGEGQEQAGEAGKATDSNNGPLTEKDIEERLKEANLPVTEEAIRKVMSALELYQSIGTLEDGAIRNLISRSLTPTIENIYKAQFSKAPGGESLLSDKAWEELLPQVKEIITAAGYEINDESLKRARWLLDKGLPLNTENYIYYTRLIDFRKLDQNEVLDEILQDMAEGISPKDTILITQDKAALEKLIEELKYLGEDEIRETLRKDRELNLKELIYSKQEEKLSEEATKKELTKEQQMEAIKALRQLEEIRLRMTMEAAVRLEKKGFHIETKQLEDVVEELRRLEEDYYRKLMAEADLEADLEQIRILKAVTDSVRELKASPSYILGTTLSLRKLMSVPTLLEEGKSLSAELSKAKEAYDSLMTQPNREYGDSLQKAFQNSVTMLEDMGMENTVYNQRALRILGYNQMDITKETMEQVKAYDLEVNSLFKNLHPAITVRMIKEGINPLNLPINELNQKINEIKEEQGITSEERFSTYLWRLEKEEGLSENERKAYIGIYRLLHTIDKSDGAALGAVIKSDREVTLSHLLSAVRSLRIGSMDTVVDDQFGALQSISFEKESITDQLNTVFGAGTAIEQEPVIHQEVVPYQEARQEFLTTVLKQLQSELSPEALSSIQNEVITQINGQPQPITPPILSSDYGIWEILKDIPIEALFDKMITYDSSNEQEHSLYESKLQELRQIYKNSDQAIRFLEDFKVPCTASNVQMAGQLLHNESTFFKKIKKLMEENSQDNSKNNLQEMEELADTLIDKETMHESYEHLENKVQSVIEMEIQSDRINSMGLAELKSLGDQMSLLKTLSKKEFYQIPVETESGITNINLTVIRGAGKTGKVNISLQSENLGKIKADLSLKGSEIYGYIACDSRVGHERLKNAQKELKDMLTAENITIKQLEVCFDPIGNELYSYQYPEGDDRGGVENRETERQLYRIAKGMVRLIWTAEAVETGTTEMYNL